MQCKSCSFHNAGDVERCHRCGRPLSGDGTVDGFSVAGATALAPQPRRPVPEDSTELEPNDRNAAAPPRQAPRAAAAAVGRQTSLFSGEVSPKVIPFDSFQRPAGPAAKTDLPRAEALRRMEPGAYPTIKVEPNRPPGRTERPIAHSPSDFASPRPKARNDEPDTFGKSASDPKPSGRKLSGRRSGDARKDQNQGSLDFDFLPPTPSARTLKTTVEASIYCDAEVAAPMHRSVAAFLDAAMILIACGLFVAIFQCFGGGVRFDKFDLVILVCSACLIGMLYGFTFAIAGRETAGQHWTELRLINFDGFPPEGMNRALRFAGTWLSFGAFGIGLVWALFDEENLTWHDHMSKTFLTMREGNVPFFRERGR